MWPHKHLLSIAGLSQADVFTLFERAEECAALGQSNVKKSNTLRGKTVVNLFFEASTRTRTSFEVAGKRAGADVVNITAASSSVTKGETLIDTVRNIESMGVDAFVVRHASSGAAELIAANTSASVINAGDGAHEHPTQALLDAFTIRKHKGRIAGLTVTLVGDILHSRVARSNALLLGLMGANVRLTGPATMMPRNAETLGPTVTVHKTLQEAVTGADVIMALRIQNERLAGAMMATTREYSRTFGINTKVLAHANSDVIVMHPGPINRGVELESSLADSPQSRILDQVASGVAVRMALLELLLGEREAPSGLMKRLP